ncbi:MAG: DUF4157 domain-containing protein [candidate division WOR-3 bacterium]
MGNSAVLQVQKKPAALPVPGQTRATSHWSSGPLALAEAPPIVHKALESVGQPLDTRVQQDMEGLLGHDFSRVRIHSGRLAVQSAQTLGTRAYSVGQDIVFGAGEYSPHTLEGLRLLSHELAHVATTGHERAVVNRWNGGDHEKLTLDAVPRLEPRVRESLSDDFVHRVARKSKKMDYRAGRIAGNIVAPALFSLGFGAGVGGILGFLAGGAIGAGIGGALGGLVGLAIWTRGFRRMPAEGPDHGEGGNYELSFSAARPRNEARQDEYRQAASSLYNEWKRTSNGTRIGTPPEEVSDRLGDAMHVAQDRGAHWEGAQNMGHADPRVRFMFAGWSPDDPSDNRQGYQNAKRYTEDVFRRFVAAIQTPMQPLPPMRDPVVAPTASIPGDDESHRGVR